MDKKQEIKLENYTVQELVQLKNQNEQQIQNYLQTYNNFKMVHQKTENDKVLVNNLSKLEQDQIEILIPLSNSLYIPGKIVNKDKYVIDIGTGYRAQRTAKQAINQLNETSKIVAENAQSVVSEIENKKEMVDKVNIQIQKKMLAQKQQQQPQKNAFKKK